MAGKAATHSCEEPARLTGRQTVEVEQHVVAEFMRLAVMDWDEAYGGDDLEALERAEADAEALLDELSSLDLRRSLGPARWTAMVEEAREEKDAATQKSTQARLRAKPTGDRARMAAVWDAADDAERQELLSSVVQVVMIDAGQLPAIERIHVLPVWHNVDLPRKGQRGFAARPWQPDAATGSSKNASADPADIR